MSLERRVEEIASSVVHAAYETRSELGVGLYESVYKRVLRHRLETAGHHVAAEVPLRLMAGGTDLGAAGRADFIINGSVLVEAKATMQIHPVHAAQTLTYLRLSGLHLALLINFNNVPFRDGIRRFVRSEGWPPVPANTESSSVRVFVSSRLSEE